MTLGFIILRYVRDQETNKYWQHAYNCIRRFYPTDPIVIVDDKSSQEFLTHPELQNATIVKSQHPRRGELLPYLYYLDNPFCDTVVILHDSVFINTHIDFETDNYRMLWDFEHKWDQPEDEMKMINAIGDDRLKLFYKKKTQWAGCFGGMSVLTHKYLAEICTTYNIHKLVDCVTTRYNRCSFERVIAVLLQLKQRNPPLLGDIKKYCKWGITFKDKHTMCHLPIIKVWSGR